MYFPSARKDVQEHAIITKKGYGRPTAPAAVSIVVSSILIGGLNHYPFIFGNSIRVSQLAIVHLGFTEKW